MKTAVVLLPTALQREVLGCPFRGASLDLSVSPRPPARSYTLAWGASGLGQDQLVATAPWPRLAEAECIYWATQQGPTSHPPI